MGRMNFLVGKVLKAQGIKGEVKVQSYMDTSDVLCSLPYLIIDGKRYLIQKSRRDKNSAVLLLDDITDRNTAELLSNKNIYVEKQDAPEPEEGMHYIDDLLGCKVSDDEGAEIGKLTDILQSGAVDVYTIKNNQGIIMIPALKTVIKEIDIADKRIILIKDKLEEVAVYEY